MIEKIQLTLYEIFGYLLPGAIALAAILIFYWAVALPLVPFPAYKMQPDATSWVVLIGLAYVLGHLVHGLGNKYLRGAEEAALGERGSIPLEIRGAGRNRAAEMMGVHPNSVDAMSLFRFADEYSIQHGQVGDRDIYVYREGFYKGCTIALFALSVAAVIRGISGGCALKMPTYIYYISRTQLFVLAIVLAYATRLCRQRFQRFGTYRVTRAFFAFMSLIERRPIDAGSQHA